MRRRAGDAAASGRRGTRIGLTLLPIAPVDRRVVHDLADAISAAMGFGVTVASERAIPVGSYDPARRQHRAEALVDLARQEAGERVLAVTESDLYSDDLNFVFGLADSSGRAAVISLHRLRADGDAPLFSERAVKEAIHELGHTMGLRHCPDPGCVMHFSNSLADTDRKATAMCDRCRRRGGAALSSPRSAV